MFELFRKLTAKRWRKEERPPKFVAGEGRDFELREESQAYLIGFAVVTGVVASLIAAFIVWCLTGFVLPEACALINASSL